VKPRFRNVAGFFYFQELPLSALETGVLTMRPVYPPAIENVLNWMSKILGQYQMAEGGVFQNQGMPGFDRREEEKQEVFEHNDGYRHGVLNC